MISVQHIQHMGSDLTVVNAARVSFGGSSQVLTEKDIKLIKYLADHDHMSPFEHCSLTVKISCPLYIRSQIHRHRTFSYNEISRRYTEKDLSFFKPFKYRKQHNSNRQASEGELPENIQKMLKIKVDNHNKRALQVYNELLDNGVCREQARGVLPQDLMTEFYMTGNLRNWCHFIKLRRHEGAQKEVQSIANSCEIILLDKFGFSAKMLLGD